MTFLELIQQALADSGTGAPEEVEDLTDATGFQLQVAGFVRESWQRIQTLHEGWGWRQREYTTQLKVGTEQYKWNAMLNPAGARSILSFRKWIDAGPAGTGPEWMISTPENGHETPVQIQRAEYPVMRRFRFQSSDTPRRPSHYAIYPDRSVVFYPSPDALYRIYGAYTAGVQILRKENDTPEGLTDDYHDMIKWRAIMMLHGNDKEGEIYAFAERNYTEMLRSLNRTNLPRIKIADTLG